MTTAESTLSSHSREPSFIKFGTDGWRAVIGEDYTFENVKVVSHAVARSFSFKKNERIFVGYDHRFLAERFAELVCSVLSSYKLKPTLLSEPVTSPFLSFVTWKNHCPFGVMITASHNPSPYLGFKVKGSFGGSISQESALKIEEKLATIDLSEVAIPAKNNTGARWRSYDHDTRQSKTDYIQYLKKHIEIDVFKKSNSGIAFDMLYGPSGKFIEEFFKSFKNRTRLHLLHNRRDPLFGALHPEPIEKNLTELKATVKNSLVKIGCALDGDGDRLGIVDENGNYLTPQQVFALLLYYLLKYKNLRGKVIQTVSLGYLSERIARDFNCPFEEVPVGFKYVADKILKEDVILGGEESGGYAFTRTRNTAPKNSILPERDGLLSALLMIEMTNSRNEPIGQLLKDLQKKYGTSNYLRNDIRLAKPIEDKQALIHELQKKLSSKWLGFTIKEMRPIDGLKIISEDGSWILIRPSGTEPLLRTYAEFPDKSRAAQTLKKLSDFFQTLLK